MKKLRYLWMLLIIAIDQGIKYYIQSSFALGHRVSVIGDFFCITYVQNTGAAFSLFDGRSKLLIVVPFLAIVFSIVYFERHKSEHWTLCMAIILIVAGGTGNLIDRILHGYVVDMISFNLFPVFNLADIAICVGCGFLILYIFFFDSAYVESRCPAADGEGVEDGGRDSSKGEAEISEQNTDSGQETQTVDENG